MIKRAILVLACLATQACVMPTTEGIFARCDHYTDPDSARACRDRVLTEQSIRGELTSIRLDRMSRGGPY